MVDSSCYLSEQFFLVSFDAERADDLARAGIDGGAGLFHVVRLTQCAFVGLTDLGADIDLRNAVGDAVQNALVVDAGAAVQHERDARDLAEVGDVLDVQTGLGLFLVAHALGDRTVDGADGDAQPVALCLLCKLFCFVTAMFSARLRRLPSTMTD